MNEKCEHKLIQLEDGTLDNICLRCRKFFKQSASVYKSNLERVSINNEDNFKMNILTQNLDNLSLISAGIGVSVNDVYLGGLKSNERKTLKRNR